MIRELQRQAVEIAADRAGVPAVDVVVTPPATMPAEGVHRIEPLALQRFDSTLHLKLTMDGKEVDHLDQAFDWHGTTMPPFDAFLSTIAPRIDHEYAAALGQLAGKHAVPTTAMTSAPLPATVEPLSRISGCARARAALHEQFGLRRGAARAPTRV